MKPLDTDFSYDQFQFHQVARDGDVALYEKRKPKHSCPTFEVILVQHRPAEVIHGRPYDAREGMPPSAAWGSAGWSYSTLDDARRKFRELAGQFAAKS